MTEQRNVVRRNDDGDEDEMLRIISASISDVVDSVVAEHARDRGILSEADIEAAEMEKLVDIAVEIIAAAEAQVGSQFDDDDGEESAPIVL